MKFRRPFRAELTEAGEIWIFDARDALVTQFPRTSENVEADLLRAQAVARCDNDDDLELGPETV